MHFYVDKLILKRIVRVRCCETERRDATSYDARWTSRLVMCTCLALNSTTVNMPPDRYVGRPYALLMYFFLVSFSFFSSSASAAIRFDFLLYYTITHWPLILRIFPAMAAAPIHVMCTKFHSNPSINYGDIASREICLKGQRTDGRIDGQPESTMLSAYNCWRWHIN